MSPTPHPRFQFLDLLKVIAIVLMIYNHVLVYLYSFSDSFTHLANITFNLTSLSSALFLFLTGLNLHLSFSRAKTKSHWAKRKATHALLLILLSLGLFLYQNSPTGHLPATGILQTIGVLWLIFIHLELSLTHSTKTWLYSLLLLVILFATELLRFYQIHLPFLTTHNFPLLPHAAFFILGLAIATAEPPATLSVHRLKTTTGIIVSLALILLTHHALNSNLIAIFQLKHIFLNYWQPSLILSTYTIILILLLYRSLGLLEPRLQHSPALTKLNLMGVYILELYLLHLFLLITLTKLARFTLTFPATLVFYLLLLTAGLIYSNFRPRLTARGLS